MRTNRGVSASEGDDRTTAVIFADGAGARRLGPERGVVVAGTSRVLPATRAVGQSGRDE